MSDGSITMAATFVPLPRVSETTNRVSKPPVWPIEASESGPAPLAAKCARNSRVDGICCKELKDDDERTLIDPDVVRDVVS
jgi:vacuolar iron transporter family protein